MQNIIKSSFIIFRIGSPPPFFFSLPCFWLYFHYSFLWVNDVPLISSGPSMWSSGFPTPFSPAVVVVETSGRLYTPLCTSSNTRNMLWTRAVYPASSVTCRPKELRKRKSLVSWDSLIRCCTYPCLSSELQFINSLTDIQILTAKRGFLPIII